MFFITDEAGETVDLYKEQQKQDFYRDRDLFHEWLKTYDNQKLPESYQNHLLRDICRLKPYEINEMSYLDKLIALHYASITFQLRSQGVSDEKNKKSESISYPQDPDWDRDPNYYSQVPS